MWKSCGGYTAKYICSLPVVLFLVLLRDVVQQLPPPNYRTLEYLSRHLYRVSLRGNDTGMTAKNVAIVWAPNLLRSKSIEIGGVAALQGSDKQKIMMLIYGFL